MGEEVSSTARTRSSFAVSTLRLSRPRCSSTWVAVIRKRVVRKRMMPSPIGIATPTSCHSVVPARRADQEDADEDGQELEQLVDRVHEQHPRVEPAPLRVAGHRPFETVLTDLLGVRDRSCSSGAWGSRHVASPASAAVRRVRSATSRSATSLSIAEMTSGPAAEAVVTVTDASPSTRPTARLLEVDGLHPRHRRDPALAREPAGLGVHRVLGALPAVHLVAHERHPDDVDQRDDDVHRPRPDRHVEPVEDPGGDQDRQHPDGRDARAGGPEHRRLGGDAVDGVAQSGRRGRRGVRHHEDNPATSAWDHPAHGC